MRKQTSKRRCKILMRKVIPNVMKILEAELVFKRLDPSDYKSIKRASK